MANHNTITAQSLQNDLTDLKAEILELSKALASNASGAAERVAVPAYEATERGVRSFAHSAKEQGQAAVDAIRENPGTTSSVALTAGVVGLVIGYMLGSSSR